MSMRTHTQRRRPDTACSQRDTQSTDLGEKALPRGDNEQTVRGPSLQVALIVEVDALAQLVQAVENEQEAVVLVLEDGGGAVSGEVLEHAAHQLLRVLAVQHVRVLGQRHEHRHHCRGGA